jgi:hypothetical protein
MSGRRFGDDGRPQPSSWSITEGEILAALREAHDFYWARGERVTVFGYKLWRSLKILEARAGGHLDVPPHDGRIARCFGSFGIALRCALEAEEGS